MVLYLGNHQLELPITIGNAPMTGPTMAVAMVNIIAATTVHTMGTVLESALIKMSMRQIRVILLKTYMGTEGIVETTHIPTNGITNDSSGWFDHGMNGYFESNLPGWDTKYFTTQGDGACIYFLHSSHQQI